MHVSAATAGLSQLPAGFLLPYRDLIRNLPVAVYICGADGRILFYNKAAVDLWGCEPEPERDRWCGSMQLYCQSGKPLLPDQHPSALAIKEQKQKANSEELFMERRDGKKRHVQISSQLVYDESGAPAAIMSTILDITKQKMDQQALWESEERFRAITDTVPVMIWMAGTDMQYSFFNRNWCEFTGMKAERQAGKGWIENVHPEDRAYCTAVFTEAFDARKEFFMEYRLKRHDGMYRWISCRGIPRYSKEGIFLGYVGSCNDIHERRVMSEELEKKVERRTSELIKKNEELERSNSELASFSYIASHDLQEPLRKIITFADMLRLQSKAGLDNTEYLDRIINSSQRMKQLIEDVLNFSRVSSSERKFIRTDLSEVVKNVLTDFDQRILEKNASVRISELPVIDANPLQMRQLFHNLISNALKFSSTAGKPVITVSAREVSSIECGLHPGLSKNLSYCEVLVSDNGIGFSQEFAEQIFVIFKRLHGKSEYSGTGIGLALCRKIADNHQGKIFARSIKGEGTVFHVLLPLRIPA